MTFDVAVVVPSAMTFEEFKVLLDNMAPGRVEIHGPGYASTRIVVVIKPVEVEA